MPKRPTYREHVLQRVYMQIALRNLLRLHDVAGRVGGEQNAGERRGLLLLRRVHDEAMSDTGHREEQRYSLRIQLRELAQIVAKLDLAHLVDGHLWNARGEAISFRCSGK